MDHRAGRPPPEGPFGPGALIVVTRAKLRFTTSAGQRPRKQPFLLLSGLVAGQRARVTKCDSDHTQCLTGYPRARIRLFLLILIRLFANSAPRSHISSRLDIRRAGPDHMSSSATSTPSHVGSMATASRPQKTPRERRQPAAASSSLVSTSKSGSIRIFGSSWASSCRCRWTSSSTRLELRQGTDLDQPGAGGPKAAIRVSGKDLSLVVSLAVDLLAVAHFAAPVLVLDAIDDLELDQLVCGQEGPGPDQGPLHRIWRELSPQPGFVVVHAPEYRRRLGSWRRAFCRDGSVGASTPAPKAGETVAAGAVVEQTSTPASVPSQDSGGTLASDDHWPGFASS